MGRKININSKHCNSRCMEDSRRQASLSRFLQRQSNIIRFSVDAFLLPQVTGTVMFSFLNVNIKKITFNYRDYWVRLGLKLGLQKVLTAHILRIILFLDGILNLSIIIDLGGVYNYKRNLLFIDIENNNFQNIYLKCSNYQK